MRIAILPSGSSVPTWLAGDPAKTEREHTSAGGLSINGERATERQTYVRAANATNRDRGNLSSVISFSTARLFPTTEEAELFALTYDEDFVREGTVFAEVQVPGGQVIRRYLTQAIVDPPLRVVTGCTVRLTYTIKGSKWTPTKP